MTGSQTQITVAPADIATLRNADEKKAYQRRLHPGWGELWSGTGIFGFAGTAGNYINLHYWLQCSQGDANKQNFSLFQID